jgi:hypothetical protein
LDISTTSALDDSEWLYGSPSAEVKNGPLGDTTNISATKPIQESDNELAGAVPTNTYRASANILSNLSIPKPSEDILAPICDDIAISATSVFPHITKGRAKKPDTLLKDNGTSSARNLYAIDYLTQHGPIPANEFKTIWDNLDREKIKEYQTKSTMAKKNAKSA